MSGAINGIKYGIYLEWTQQKTENMKNDEYEYIEL